MKDTRKSSGGWAISVVILAGLAPVTWLISSIAGYALSGVFVLATLGLSLYNGRLSMIQWPVFAGIGVYWIVLVLHFILTGSNGIISYIMLVPLVVVALMMGGAQLIENDPTRFAAGVVALSSLLVIIGFIVLWGHLWWGWPATSMTGRRTLGLFHLRIASIYSNSNHLGFAAAFGALSATYLWKTTKQNLWLVFTIFLIVGVAMANARTSLIATGVGIGIIVIRTRPRLQELPLVPLGVLAVAGLTLSVLSGFMVELLYSLFLRLETWNVAIQAIVAEPWLGEAWRSSFGIHNMFLIIIRQTGIVGGISYIFVHLLALAYAGQNLFEGTAFDRYVFAILVFLITTQFFSTSTLGGLTTPSLLLAIFIGLAARRGNVSLPWRRQVMDVNTGRQVNHQMNWSR